MCQLGLLFSEEHHVIHTAQTPCSRSDAEDHFPVPERLAADVEALVERAEALGFDVSIEEKLEAAYRRIHAKLAKEMKALDVDFGGADALSAEVVEEIDGDEGAGEASAIRAVVPRCTVE